MLSPARLLLKRGGTHIWERGDDPGECFIDPVYGGCQVGAPLAQTTPHLPVPRSKEKISAWQPSCLGKSRGTPLVGEAAEGRRNSCHAPPLFTAGFSQLVVRCTPPLLQRAPLPHCIDLSLSPRGGGKNPFLLQRPTAVCSSPPPATAVTSFPALPASGPSHWSQAPPFQASYLSPISSIRGDSQPSSCL